MTATTPQVQFATREDLYKLTTDDNRGHRGRRIYTHQVGQNSGPDRFNDTRVHFHRTHPSRSKGGDYNPIHNWTKVCYNWMVGNIKRDRIIAQQGDLAFVKIKTDPNDESLEGAAVTGLTFDHKVEQYDNHCFAEPVAFAEYTKKAKSNILGYVQLEQDTELRHNEHDNEGIPAGTYAIHQARSWEANPKGVWSLNID